MVFVVFFATTGAHLDLPLLGRLWPVALALAVTRALVRSVRALARRFAADPAPLRTGAGPGSSRRLAWRSASRAMVGRTFPQLGSGFRALATATVALNEMVGPCSSRSPSTARARARRAHGRRSRTGTLREPYRAGPGGVGAGAAGDAGDP